MNLELILVVRKDKEGIFKCLSAEKDDRYSMELGEYLRITVKADTIADLKARTMSIMNSISIFEKIK